MLSEFSLLSTTHQLEDRSSPSTAKLGRGLELAGLDTASLGLRLGLGGDDKYVKHS